MTHSTINYSAIADKTERKAKAIQDIKDWLGVKKFNSFSKDVKACQPPMTYAQFEFACGMGGIEGYPVTVWADELGVAADTLDAEPAPSA